MPHNDKSDLFSPIMIGGLKARNRIILPALILNFPIKGIHIGEEWRRFYRRRAEGGAGLIIVGACYVNRSGQQDRLQLGVDHDGWVPELAGIAQVIKEGGAIPVLQLNHAGRYAFKEITGIDPVAPSAIASRYTKQTPREMTSEEVEETIESFAAAACRAQNAGFEAIELLGATGYLISQFLSPLTNRRKDHYGGSFEGRLSFVRELIEAIKRRLGDDYPIIFRLSSLDNIPGGMDKDDQIKLAVELAEWGVHLINVTAGWHDAPVSQIGPSVPQGHFVPYAEKIKDHINIPVSCAVRITSPEFARSIIDKGIVDMVTLGRALIADPDWPLKAMAIKDKEIRRCICCCHCFDRAFARARIECSINAQLCKDDFRPSTNPKKILIIGGGPAGMEAARVLAIRRHSVVLLEKEGTLGGVIEIASKPPFKDEFVQLVEFLSNELQRLKVDVKTGGSFDQSAEGFDGIIVATGADEKNLDIKGMADIPCFMAGEILSKKAMPIDPVIIIGAGLVGGETADFLSSRGFKVSMIEMMARPFSGMGPSLLWILKERLRKNNVKIHTSSQLLEVKKGKAIVNTSQGEITLKAGCIIIAAGFKSERAIAKNVRRSGLPCCVIGDCKQPGQIKDAIEQGYWAGTEWVDGI